MRKKSLVVFLFVVLMTSACSTQPPVETAAPAVAETETRAATATEAPTAIETPSAQASATSTPETPIPTNSPDCTNSAAFVADVTIADNEIVPASAAFTKTWRVRNTGTCIWGPDYTVSHYSEESMLAPSSVPLSVTFPDKTVDISMDLTAPNTDGNHRGYFVIKNPAGLIMKIDSDSRLWVVINVSSQVAAATQTTAASQVAAATQSTAASQVAVATQSTVPGQVAAATQSTGSIPVTGGFAKATCAFTTDAVKVTETINALNAYRAQNGLPAYTVNELLTKAASAQANDMACNKLFAHKGSDGSTPPTRVAASGYSASTVTENVYGSYPPLSGQGAVEWWKNDKTDIRHNQNLLSTTYTEIGVGYSFFDNFGYYALVFAAPK